MIARFALLSLVFVAIGCGAKEPEVVSAPPKPSDIPFIGTFDRSLVGVWQTTSKDSTLDLGEDGSVKIEAVQPGSDASLTTKLSGKWLVDESTLLMQYAGAGHPVETVAYPFKVKGKTMTLTKDSKDTIYTRQ